MYSKPKQNKRAFSFIIALCLAFNIVLTSGVMPVTVFAEDISATIGTQVFYVDGVGNGEKDGSSEENALQYVSEAYEKIPEGNVKTTIVICGGVDFTKDPGLDTLSGTIRAFKWRDETGKAAHSGEVVFTAKHGDVNHYGNNNVYISFPTNFALLGNTTYEYIDFHARPANLLANYFNLQIGEGIGRYLVEFAGALYLGTTSNIWNSYKAEAAVKNVKFTMKSGKIGQLYGGAMSDQGWGNRVEYSLDMNITGGTVNELILASGGTANGVAKIKEANVVISGGMVDKLTKAQGYGAFTEDAIVSVILDLQGKAVSMNVGEGLALSIVDGEVRQNKETGEVTGGTFTNTGAGSVSTTAIKDPTSKMYFLAVENEGVYRAYPFNMTISAEGINTIAKNPDDQTQREAAICLRTTFMAFKGLEISDYGIMIGDEKYTALNHYAFDGNIIHTYMDLLGSLRENTITLTKSARAYMTVNGVDYVSVAREITPADIIRGIHEKMESGELALSDYHTKVIADLMEKIGA